MGQEIVFFINELSGQGQASTEADQAKTYFPGLRISSSLPKSTNELTSLCSSLDQSKTSAAVVFGGDGTLNYAIRGLVQSGIPLFPYPSGTANDLAMQHGITGSADQLRRLFETKSIRDVRVLEVNGIPFSTIGGIGIGARICDDFNSLRLRHPIFNKAPKQVSCEVYSLLALKHILSTWGEGHRVKISSDDRTEIVDTSVLMICNQSTLAGNLKIAPDQSPDQDEFTVIYHQDRSGIATLGALAALKLGRLSPAFKSFKAKRVRIDSLTGEKLKVFGDGEILTQSTSLEFKTHLHRLRIFSEN